MQESIIFYLVAPDKKMRQVNADKFKLNYTNGINITIEHYQERNDLVVRGYWGLEEFSKLRPEKFVFFNILPQSGSQVLIRAGLVDDTSPNLELNNQEVLPLPAASIIYSDDSEEFISEREIIADYGNGRIVEIVLGSSRRNDEILFLAKQQSEKLSLLKMTPGGCNLVVFNPDFK